MFIFRRVPGPVLTKAQQLSLFDMPVHVAGSVDKNGVERAPYMAKRRKKLSATAAHMPPVPTATDSRLDGFIAKHGGPRHLKAEMDKMTPEQRGKLVDAMALLNGSDHAAVMAKLASGPGDQTDPAPAAAPPSQHQLVEHVTGKGKTLRGIVRTDLTVDQAKAIDAYTFKKDGGWFIREKHLEVADKLDAAHHAGVITPEQHAAARAGAAEDGAAGAVAALSPPADPPEAPPAADAEPQEGDTKTEDGVQYVLRDGRWHRAQQDEPPVPTVLGAPEPAPEPPPLPDHERELIEDREDLADHMANDPHSDAAKESVRQVVKREQAIAEPDFASTDGQDDDPNSPNYRFRDTGYVAGSRKEAAALDIRRAARNGMRLRVTDVDWDELESNPREAADLVKKSNLFGTVDWDALRAAGMEPGAGFLLDRVYASISVEPSESSHAARRDYAMGLESVRDRLEKCRTPQEVTDALGEIKDEMLGIMLSASEAIDVQVARDEYRRLREIAQTAREQSDAVYQVWNQLQMQLNGVSYERDKRVRRKWKPDPKLEAQFAELEPQVESAHQAYMAHRDSRPELQSKKRDHASGWTTYDNDLEDAASQQRKVVEALTEASRMRNLMENPMTRAWGRLGQKFINVLNWRSTKGSDSFASHVTAAKNGKINDWSWTEKETGVRVGGATKREVGFQLKVAENFERIGGNPVTMDSTATLKATFGLRDVQSGNWVLNDQNSAAFHVQRAAEALADLSDLMGVPYADISMHGRLALSFGARGKGNAGFGGAARAHYESVHRVINLTKMGGGGALGHELFHAIDNLMKESEGYGAAGADDFVTENPDLLAPGEMRDAVVALRAAMLNGPHRTTEKVKYSDRDHRTAKYNIDRPGTPVARAIKEAGDAAAAALAIDQYYAERHGALAEMPKRVAKQHADWRRLAVAYHDGNAAGAEVFIATGPARSRFGYEATVLDGGAGGKYWSQTKEMAARAFQAWTEDRLQGMGRRNDYLSVMADNKFYVDPLFGPQFPFPEGEERARINLAFDHLVGVMARRGTFSKAFAALLDRGDLTTTDPDPGL